MRERENKRKANLKKKTEREQKEREARAKMGISEPGKGFYVGPSQIRLSGFLGKRKREESRMEMEMENKEDKELEPGKSEEEESQTTKENNPEPLLANGEKAQPQSEACMPPIPPMAPPKSRAPLQLRPANSIVFPISRAPLQPRSANPIIRPKPLFFAEPPKPSVAIEDDWDSFFSSNTQVEREIACPNTTAKFPIADIPPARPRIRPVIDDTDILDMISTQDLDYAEEEAPFEPCVTEDETKCKDYPKRSSDPGDEAKQDHDDAYRAKEHKVKEQPGCKAETKQESSSGDDLYPESDYGDDTDCFREPGDTDINFVDFNNPPPFGLDELDEDVYFGNYLSDQEHEDDPLTVMLNSPTFLAKHLANKTPTPPTLPPTKTDDSNFDDGIKDEEFEDFAADCESKPSDAPQDRDAPATEPFTASRESPALVLENFDYGDFELSTQEMRELGT